MIFCPKKANTSFQHELEDRIQEPYSMYTAEKKIENEEARYIIFNHTTMHKYESYIKKLSEEYNIMSIVDEVHIMQTNKTKQSKTLRRLRKYFSCVVGLTATPILNNKEGLYYIIDFIRPNFFGNFTTFEKRYLKYELKKIRRGRRTIRFKDYTGFKRKKELKKKLGLVCQIRKREYDLDFYYRKVDMDSELWDEYVQAGRGILEDTEDGIKDFGPRLHDLQRVVDNVHEEINQVELSNKERLLLKTVRDEIINKNQGCLIYVSYKATESRLKRLFEEYEDNIGYNNLYRITGSIKQSERDYVEDNLGRKDVVIINEAGTESINLGEVNNIVFYDIPYAIQVFIQAVGRITRLDTEYDKQNVYILEVKETIDTYKRLMIQDNTRIVKEILGGNSNLPKDIKNISNKYKKKLRRKLLWKFGN